MPLNGGTSVDGNKLQACNSKDRNFTKNKLAERIKWLNGHIGEFLMILDDADSQDELEEEPERINKELIEKKLQEAWERLCGGL